MLYSFGNLIYNEDGSIPFGGLTNVNGRIGTCYGLRTPFRHFGGTPTACLDYAVHDQGRSHDERGDAADLCSMSKRCLRLEIRESHETGTASGNATR